MSGKTSFIFLSQYEFLLACTAGQLWKPLFLTWEQLAQNCHCALCCSGECAPHIQNVLTLEVWGPPEEERKFYFIFFWGGEEGRKGGKEDGGVEGRDEGRKEGKKGGGREGREGRKSSNERDITDLDLEVYKLISFFERRKEKINK